ncbi:MAG: hypothetical protein WHV66_05165 [Anaerolineales bacterium]|jgi:thioredoxin-like negative regulator of GroEL
MQTTEAAFAWAGQHLGEYVRLAKVVVDESSNLTMQFEIISILTVIPFKNGQPAETGTGLQARQKLIGKFEPRL